MASDEMGERSEPPTARRKGEARREGNIAKSPELGGALLLVAATLLVALLGPGILGRFKSVLTDVLTDDVLGSPLVVSDAAKVATYVAVAGARIALPILLLLAVSAYVFQFIQVGWLITLKPLQPTLSKLDPIKGAKRLVDLSMAYLSPIQGVGKSALLVLNLAIRILVVLLLLGLLDYAYQRWKNFQDLKMTKQEVKDEMKSVEGDPLVKRRRYRMQQSIAIQRINSAIPQADVIVTNPDHISIAIQYDAETMAAPIVVAKGADYLALRIRQLALLNSIPIVERPPLARALYKQAAVGQEIPPDFYNAVAEILAYVYQLDGRMAG
jgi:flagellar biosynthetic protein FlhB